MRSNCLVTHKNRGKNPQHHQFYHQLALRKHKPVHRRLLKKNQPKDVFLHQSIGPWRSEVFLTYIQHAFLFHGKNSCKNIYFSSYMTLTYKYFSYSRTVLSEVDEKLASNTYNNLWVSKRSSLNDIFATGRRSDWYYPCTEELRPYKAF